MSDSTNVDRPGYTESERAVRPRLEELFVRSERRLIVSCFSSSIHRLQQILDLADEYGRKVAFLGRSMLNVTEIAHNLGLLSIPDSVLLRPQDIMQMAPEKVAVVVSGIAKASRCRLFPGWPLIITKASTLNLAIRSS